LDRGAAYEVAARVEVGRAEDELEPDLQEQSGAVVQDLGHHEVGMDDRVEVALDPAQLLVQGLEPREVHRSAYRVGTELVRMPTRELATSTPMVPTTMRWIHCLAARADLDSTAVIFQMNAKIKASAPIEPTSAWPMWIHVVMRLVIGVMSGSPARNGIFRPPEGLSGG